MIDPLVKIGFSNPGGQDGTPGIRDDGAVHRPGKRDVPILQDGATPCSQSQVLVEDVHVPEQEWPDISRPQGRIALWLFNLLQVETMIAKGLA